MNIGLMAVDSKYPNLALMKIAAWHKQNGDNVDWYSQDRPFDKLYMAKIFNFSPDYDQPIENVPITHIKRGGYRL